MSDYLANVIARNLEVADRLQPRAVSIFEPTSGPHPGERAAAYPSRLEQLEEHVFVEPGDPSSREVAPAVRSTPQPQKPHATRRAGDERAAAPFVPPEQSEPSRTVVSRDDHDATQPTAVGRDRPHPEADRQVSPASVMHSTDAASATDTTPHVANAPVPRPNPTPPPDAAQPPRPLDKTVATRARPSAAAHPQRAAAPKETTRVTIERSLDRPRADVASTAEYADAGPAHTRPIEVRSDDGRPTGRSTAIEADARPGSLPRANDGPAVRRPSELLDELANDVAQVLKPAVARASQSALPVQVRLRQEVDRDASVPPFAAVQAPSTIHVTIGRIEVRATPEAARPSQSRSTPASSGLDDYLRRRAEGSGR